MRLLIASATAMVILGAFGIKILGARSDWLAYYAAGYFLLHGRIGQIYDPVAVQAWEAPWIGPYLVRFLYPPAYSLPLLPLSLLPLAAARLVWLIIGSAAALASAWLWTSWSKLSFAINTLSLLAFPPLAYSLAIGQTSPLTLLVFSTVAYLEARGDHAYLPGATAGLALYKPQLLLPLAAFWLFRRRWRSLSGLLLSALVVGLVSWLISRDASLEYLRLSLDFLRLAENATASGANASLFAISPWLGILTGLGVITVICFIAKQEQNRYNRAMLWLAPVLVTPYVVIYDLLLIALPVSFLIPLLMRDRLLQVAVAAIWITPLLAIAIQTTRPVTWAALGLFILCAWRTFKMPASLDAATEAVMDHIPSS